jgi:hypothetical protein
MEQEKVACRRNFAASRGGINSFELPLAAICEAERLDPKQRTFLICENPPAKYAI